MSNHSEHRQFLPDDDFDRDQLIVDVPVAPDSPYVDRIPSSYVPMGEIYLRGRSYRSLASGRVPWWVLISGWVIYGSLILSAIIPLLISGEIQYLPLLGLTAIPLWILWRGTMAKFSPKDHR